MVKCNQAPAKDGQCPLRNTVKIGMSVFRIYFVWLVCLMCSIRALSHILRTMRALLARNMTS